MAPSFLPSFLGRQSVDAVKTGSSPAQRGRRERNSASWEIVVRSAGMPLSPDQVGIGAHPISRSIDTDNPLPKARDRFGVDFLDPVEFAPDRPGLNQAVENESPIHFHRRRRSRHCVTLISRLPPRPPSVRCG